MTDIRITHIGGPTTLIELGGMRLLPTPMQPVSPGLEVTMSELDDFLAWVDARQRPAELAIHNGDAEPRVAIWSHNEPVTLFGAEFTASGWADVSRVFRHLAERFSDCTSYEYEVIAAGVSGDAGYTVGYERSMVSVHGQPRSYTLRVTHGYRREQGEWKIAHRHGDVPPANALPG